MTRKRLLHQCASAARTSGAVALAGGQSSSRPVLAVVPKASRQFFQKGAAARAQVTDPYAVADHQEPFIDIFEAAEWLLGKSGQSGQRAMWRLIEQHSLPCRRVGGVYRFKKSELELWSRR